MSDKMFEVKLSCRTAAKDEATAIEDVIAMIQDGAADLLTKEAKEVEMTAFEKAQQEMFSD